MHTRLKSNLMAASLSILAGAATALLLGIAALLLSLLYFAHIAPHDGMDGLAALIVGFAAALLTFPIASILLYFPFARKLRKRFDAGID